MLQHHLPTRVPSGSVSSAGGIFVPGRAPPQRATEAYIGTPQPGHRRRQKQEIGFEASCEVVSVARSPRSVLVYVSRHRSQRGRIVRRIGAEVLLLVGHPGLEPGANGLRTHLKYLKILNFSTISRAT